MAFKTQADPQQSRLKVSMYGPPGSGKTFTALLFAEGLAKVRGKRVAFLDTERGTDFYAKDTRKTDSPRPVHPEPFVFDAEYHRSISKALEDVRSIDYNHTGVIIIDSISHLWEATMEAYDGRRNARDAIPIHAWSKIKRPYKTLINMLMAAPLDVFILGRQKNIFGKDEDGEMAPIGVGMKAEGETAYEPHICLRMENERHPSDPTRSRSAMYVEKDRTGVLQGKMFYNPNFSTIEPLLPLLGDVQAGMEDEEERQARDAEAMSVMDEEKSRAKEAKSAAIFADLSARAAAAKNSDDLGAVAADYKRQKRYIGEVHEGALRELFTAARDRIFPKTA